MAVSAATAGSHTYAVTSLIYGSVNCVSLESVKSLYSSSPFAIGSGRSQDVRRSASLGSSSRIYSAVPYALQESGSGGHVPTEETVHRFQRLAKGAERVEAVAKRSRVDASHLGCVHEQWHFQLVKALVKWLVRVVEEDVQ